MISGPIVTPLRAGSRDAAYVLWLVERTPSEFHLEQFPPDPAGKYSYRPCPVTKCERAVYGLADLCRVHHQEMQRSDIDSAEDFAIVAKVRKVSTKAHGGLSARGILDLTSVVSPVLRAELALVIWLKASGEFGGPIRANDFNAFVVALAATEVRKLRDLEDDAVSTRVLAASGSHRKAFISFIRSFPSWIAAEEGDESGRRKIGTRRGGSTRWSKAQQIEVPWLRQMVQDWVTYRMQTEAASAQHIGQQEGHVTEFAIWAIGEGLKGPEGLTRKLLLRWLGYVNLQRNAKGEPFYAGYRRAKISAVNMMVSFARIELTDSIPNNAIYLPREMPSLPPSNPRFLEPKVIETLRDETNLALISNPSHRAAIEIMMHVGTRAGHTCALPFDCLVDLNNSMSTDKWALRFVDTKTNKALSLPIVPEAARAIQGQQIRAITESKKLGLELPEMLFPNARARKTRQLAPETLNVAIRAWVTLLDLREANGELVNVTPHRFRHTFATELLERGAPIEIVRDLLGHTALKSTEVYAHVTDARLRSEWEKAKFVNVRGEVLGLPEGEAADAEWLLHKMSRVVQPLSNGGCALPIQHTCPHANACLDNCEHFVTSPEFLPVLEAQNAEAKRTISKAEAAGHLRIVEINRRPQENLDRIILSLKSQEVS